MTWDPLHELLHVHTRGSDWRQRSAAGWLPPVDLHETPAAFVMVAELPGFGPADVQVNATVSSLTLSGHRPTPEAPGDQYLRMERGQGPFSRTFEFREAIDPAGITAEFDRGLLTVTIPKSRSLQSRRIDVR